MIGGAIKNSGGLSLITIGPVNDKRLIGTFLYNFLPFLTVKGRFDLTKGQKYDLGSVIHALYTFLW
jgi:hypothetical protein